MIAGDAIAPGEVASEKNPAIGLKGNGGNKIAGPNARIERRIKGAVGIEPGNTAAHHAVDVGKEAADENLFIRSQRDGANGTICAAGRIEALVERTIHIEAGDASASGAVDVLKITADKHLAGANTIGRIRH